METFHHYRVYLLRIWQETPDSPWRISMQYGKTGELKLFANLDAFYHFLQTDLDYGDEDLTDDVTIPSR